MAHIGRPKGKHTAFSSRHQLPEGEDLASTLRELSPREQILLLRSHLAHAHSLIRALEAALEVHGGSAEIGMMHRFTDLFSHLLSRGEASILAALYGAYPRVVASIDLLSHVPTTGDPYGRQERLVAVLISRTKTKLNDRTVVENVWGEGYRLAPWFFEALRSGTYVPPGRDVPLSAVSDMSRPPMRETSSSSDLIAFNAPTFALGSANDSGEPGVVLRCG